jgi:hypothetical protein
MQLQKKLLPLAIFFVVANPATFKLTSGLLGPWVADYSGKPTQLGLLLHALVYVILSAYLWKAVYGNSH